MVYARTVARKQEQEPARDVVTEVAPGVLRFELPIRMPGLGHVNCYALVDGEGVALVDPGLPGPLTWRAIRDRLRKADLEPRHVHTVIVTHSHPDHFGGAARIARETNARVVAHRGFGYGYPGAGDPEVSVEDLPANHAAPTELVARSPMGGGPPPWGGRGGGFGLLTRLRWRARRLFNGQLFMPAITHRVEQADVLRLAGREWFVLHTPGHTPDHLCLHDPESGTLLAGDHVLPSITPHISGFSPEPDPLKSFFDALDQVARLPNVARVLPAHGHPFRDLPGRVEAIKRHHHQRLERLGAISRALGPACVGAFSQELFKKRSWGPMADSETFAHLEHLRLKGAAERWKGSHGEFLYVVG